MSSQDDQIVHVERHFDVRFPQDFRDFLVREESMSRFVPPAGDFLAINPITALVDVNEASDIQERLPGAIVIGGDGSRELLAYDFRSEPPCLVLLDVTCDDWSSVIYQAPSLSALLEQFPGTGWNWADGIQDRSSGAS